MPKNPIRDLLNDIAERIAGQATRAVGEALESELARKIELAIREKIGTVKVAKVARGKAARKVTGTVTRWVADRRARRVPNFVIKATGLKKKVDIVARYGANAVFVEGEKAPNAKPGRKAGAKVVAKRGPGRPARKAKTAKVAKKLTARKNMKAAAVNGATRPVSISAAA
jgi:hypothetical protein